MYLKSLELTNFRNYEELKLELSKNINLIYGENAQGKTNLLESIYFLAITKSHRSFIDDNLIKNNAKNFIIKGDIVTKTINKKIKISFTDKSKKLFIDNNEIKKTSDYLSNLNVIIFYPEDLELIKYSPSIRRKYLDIEIGQLDKNYLKILSEYNKLLKIRNDLLKNNLKGNKFDENYMSSLEEHLIKRATSIYYMRNRFIKKINKYLPEIYQNITSFNDLYLDYQANSIKNIDSKEEISKELINLFQSQKELDLKNGRTNIGPHLDDFIFNLKNENLKNYGSQGQQRSAVLSLKLAEIKIFEKYTNEKPILLLDDVFSELDENKRNNLLKYLLDDIQTIITTTDVDLVNPKLLNGANILEIKEGKIQKRKGDLNGK